MDFKHSESQSSYNNSESSRKEYVVREIELFNSFIRDADVKRSKFKEMGHSPFAFYRATAHLFYRDIFHSVIPIPPEWKSTPKISTWIQGDLHLKNFGFFDNDKGEIKFDINDFDESYIAPFYWDIIRFTIGIFLIRKLVEDFNLSNSESEDIIDEFIDEYKEMLKEI
ncbi:MAG: DUF2252 family protein, partial [Leptospiraceae bacterium]|nr:DUF2252 family protein [Leptospiraceae bacterium]